MEKFTAAPWVMGTATDTLALAPLAAAADTCALVSRRSDLQLQLVVAGRVCGGVCCGLWFAAASGRCASASGAAAASL